MINEYMDKDITKYKNKYKLSSIKHIGKKSRITSHL